MTTVPYSFGNESSPIPLSQLDANFAVTPNYANTAGNIVNPFQANITALGTLTSLSVSGNISSVGSFSTAGLISAAGNVTVGNISTGGTVSAYGNVTGGNLVTTSTVTGSAFNSTGTISAVGNVTGGNLITGGKISSLGNVFSQAQISAVGNIVTAAYFVGNFLGNITGNLSVGGSNTQILFNLNGNVGAAGGLTYNKDSNVLGILGTVSAQGNVTAGGNLTVAGASQFSGLVTAPTAVPTTANNQVATTAFVSSTLGTLGTMARQNAVSVAIQGGTIGNAIITLASFANGTVSNSAITNSTIDRITMTSGWSVTPSGGTLYFTYNGVNMATLDSSGNFTTLGDVTAFGSI